MSAKKPRAGEDFEKQFRASVPPGVYVKKMTTPAPPVPGGRLLAYVKELLGGRPVPPWVAAGLMSRFTASPGYDFTLSAPAPVPPLAVGVAGAQPRIVFCLELKSTDDPSIRFDRLEDGQEKALADAAAHGQIAGLVIEWRKVGEVWFLPISAWMDARLTAQRQSLPLADCRRLGMEILPDPYRGTTRAYWNIADWLTRCGCLIPERPATKARKVAAASIAPPGQPSPFRAQPAGCARAGYHVYTLGADRCSICKEPR